MSVRRRGSSELQASISVLRLRSLWPAVCGLWLFAACV